MKPIHGYHLIEPKELFWRPSNLMRIPNAGVATGELAAELRRALEFRRGGVGTARVLPGGVGADCRCKLPWR